jgi:hypothetical protein
LDQDLQGFEKIFELLNITRGTCKYFEDKKRGFENLKKKLDSKQMYIKEHARGV